jgi:hypothetical protein
MVITRTVVRDSFGEAESARIDSMLTLVIGIAPIVSPSVGGWLMDLGVGRDPLGPRRLRLPVRRRRRPGLPDRRLTARRARNSIVTPRRLMPSARCSGPAMRRRNRGLTARCRGRFRSRRSTRMPLMSGQTSSWIRRSLIPSHLRRAM